MLAQLKIIWQFHAYPVHQKVSRFVGLKYIGDDFFLGPNLVSFNRNRNYSALKKSRPQYISAQKISTLFDALDEREIAR